MGEYKYKKRIADSLLDLQLESAGAILIEGPKWCGKTTTAEQKAKAYCFWMTLKTSSKISCLPKHVQKPFWKAKLQG